MFLDSPPRLAWVPPLWRPNVRNTVLHSHIPPVCLNVAVMRIAQQHPIVGMRRSALSMGSDVVDFAPVSRCLAARYYTSTIPCQDCTPLISGEDSLPVSQLNDLSLGVGGVVLDRSGTGSMSHPYARDAELPLVGLDRACATLLHVLLGGLNHHGQRPSTQRGEAL